MVKWTGNARILGVNVDNLLFDFLGASEVAIFCADVRRDGAGGLFVRVLPGRFGLLSGLLHALGARIPDNWDSARFFSDSHCGLRMVKPNVRESQNYQRRLA